MRNGERVILESFEGKLSSPVGCREDENFWILISKMGTVQEAILPISVASYLKQPAVLVKFDNSLSELGLVSHNDVENSIWIRVSDLKTIDASNC